ncbi:MAG: ABC transporter permease [Treponema sp.]|nr:ABC transporter permease [Treponema sp.]
MQLVTFFIKQRQRLLLLVLQHLGIVGLSLGVSFIFALTVGYLLTKNKLASTVAVGFFSALYSIPSIALFALLLPMSGLGLRTAVIVISIYAQLILLRSVIAGFKSIDEAIIETSLGLGLSPGEILFRIQLPLAAPVILSGVRLASVSAIGIGTIAASINSGGIGALLFEGIRNLYPEKIIWGIILSSSLCFGANQLFGKLERLFAKRARGEIVRRKDKNAPEAAYDAAL